MPKGPARKVKRADVMSPLQSKLLGDIERALRNKYKITKTALEAAGGPSQQVLDKWARGASPRLDTLEKFVDAMNRLVEPLSTELIVVIPGVSDPSASFSEHYGEAMSAQSKYDKELADLIAAMKPEERLILLGSLREQHRRPSEPDADESRSTAARSSASSGSTT